MLCQPHPHWELSESFEELANHKSMRNLIGLSLCLCVSSFYLEVVAPAQTLQFAELGDFKLDNGEAIRDCRIGYRTLGTLNADKSNIILFPTWALGTTE